jgi:serine/threonine protein kinase
LKCPSCKAAVSDDSQFCSKCGASLKGEAQTRTIQGPSTLFKKGQLIARKYRIIQKIGEGGMGVVYKAQDTKLDRPVALKFLPSGLTRDPASKKRFIQEAKAAAALNHPNITTVHEIGEDEGRTFIAMEFIEGKTLRERIESGPIEIEEAVGIASQVAEGLKEAHDRGIIHRDIKPANIMLTGRGQAKIMDFGLAKLVWGPDLTKPSMIMGTVAYMSPEQARGEAVDHRTDIWSLGAMLYEMLAEKKPFQKSQEHALVHAILNEKPESLVTARPDIPRAIERAVLKALEKDAARRYQNLIELLKDLKSTRIAGIKMPKEDKSIIVLPFEDMSPGKDNEYFSDGLTEEIIADLSRIHDLLVISRSSAMTFKGTQKTIPEIAQAVNVRYVLEGSVRKAGNDLRITAQLIDAKTDAHLWAEKYGGTLDDVFDIQEKVSRSIVDVLMLKLTAEEKQKMSERPINDVIAYESYLKANADIFTFAQAKISRAIRHIQHALKITGDNALLYSGLGFAYWNLVNIGVQQEEYLAKAEDCVRKALKIDPEFPKGHAILGWVSCLKGNTQEGVPHFKMALAKNADESLALIGLASCLQLLGKIPAAATLSERLLQIAPLDFPTHWIHGAQHFYSGEFNRALEIWRTLPELWPENPWSHFSYALALAYNQEADRAYDVIEKGEWANSEDSGFKLGQMLKYAIQGDREKAREELTQECQRTFQRDAQYSHLVAGFFSLLDSKDEAIDWLENAVNRGFINYPLLNVYDYMLDNLREELRFKKLMERVKHEWENFEV